MNSMKKHWEGDLSDHIDTQQGLGVTHWDSATILWIEMDADR